MSALRRTFRIDFKDQVGASPDALALIDARNDCSWSWRELDSVLARIGDALAQAGVRAGDTVMSLLPNSVEKLCLYLSCMRYGLNFAPLPPDASEREIHRLRMLVPTRLCLALPSISEHSVESFEDGPLDLIRPELDGQFAWLAEHNDAPARQTPLAAEGESLLYVATSGSTGDPKVMVIDNDALWSSAKAWVGFHDFLGAHSRFYNIMPMSYLGGLFNLGLIPLAAGGTSVVADAYSGTSILRFWHDVTRFEINTLWLVPTIMKALIQVTGKHWPTVSKNVQPIEAAFLGTAPASLQDKEEFESVFQIPLIENLGLSETTFITSETMESRSRRGQGTVGEVLPYVDARLVPASDDEDGAGLTMLEVKTPFLFRGYLREGGDVQLTLTDDGYFPTGDYAHIDEQGRVLLKGRSRDIIKKGGVFIQLAEIEAVVTEEPWVSDAVAVSIENDFYGEDYVLFVVLAEGGQGTEADVARLRKLISEKLVKAKWPANIKVIDEVPKTVSGKIAKGDLRKALSVSQAKGDN